MKTIAHKEAVATHPVSSITIDTTVNHGDTSIGQAIAQALADGSKPSAEQSAADSHLPKIDIPGFGRDAPSLTDHSPGNSPRETAAASRSIRSRSTRSRRRWRRWATPCWRASHKDPQRDTPDDWLPGSHPSSADLRADVGITHGSSDAGAHNQAAAATLIEHSQASREKAEGMLGKYLGNDGFVGPDELRSDGKWHNTAMDASDQGITVMRDYVRTDNGGIKLASTTVIDSNNHTATTVRDDGSTVTSKDGKVVDTTDPLELPSSTPDADRPTTLPSLRRSIEGPRSGASSLARRHHEQRRRRRHSRNGVGRQCLRAIRRAPAPRRSRGPRKSRERHR